MKFEITNDNFDVEFSMKERLLCLKRRLIIPLRKITSVRIMGDEAMEGVTLRLIGTGPLVGYRPGLFLQYGEKAFFNAHEGMEHLVIQTDDFFYRRIVLDYGENNKENTDRLLALKG